MATMSRVRGCFRKQMRCERGRGATACMRFELEARQAQKLGRTLVVVPS